MNEIENVKERLLQYIKYKGLSQAKFEKACGLSNGYVNNLRTSIGPNKIPNIVRQFPDLNIAWLVLGEKLGGPMIMGEEKKDVAKPVAPILHSLPLIPIEVFAGPGEPAYEDEKIEDYYTVSEFKNSDFILRVKGDSMTPKLNGGDLVACKKVELYQTYFIQWGRVYVLFTKSQGAMIKRLQPSEKEGWIKCVSDNEKYAPFDVPMDDVASLALVNGSISVE